MSKILIIEDNLCYAGGLSFLLADLGHESTVAVDGPEGLAEWERGGYDAVLVDQWMPMLDGISTIREARSRGLQQGVILLTCLLPDEVDKRIDGLDVWAVIEKKNVETPMFREALQAAIEFTRMMYSGAVR